MSGGTGDFTDKSRLYAGLSGESWDFTDESRRSGDLSGKGGVFTDKVRRDDGLSGERAGFTDKVIPSPYRFFPQAPLPGSRKQTSRGSDGLLNFSY